MIGVCALLGMLLSNFISVAAMAASFSFNTFNEQTTGLERAKIILINGIWIIVCYIIFTLINYFLAKKEKINGF